MSKRRSLVQPKYPWHIWQDGKLHTIQHGPDFTVEPTSMRVQILKRAWAKHIYARTQFRGSSIDFIFFDDLDEAKAYKFPTAGNRRGVGTAKDERKEKGFTCRYCDKVLEGWEAGASLTHCTGTTSYPDLRDKVKALGHVPNIHEGTDDEIYVHIPQ